MPRAFYSLGYNTADPFSIKLNEFYMNDHDYPSEFYDEAGFNISTWWTPTLETNIRAKFSVALDEIIEDCSLKKGDEVFLSLYSYCPSTKMQHRGTVELVNSNEMEIHLQIPPCEIADELNLFATLTVRFDESKERKVGSPVISNSRLLSKSWKIFLSGSRTQANVITTDFSLNSQISKALWNIKIREGYDMDTWLTAQHSSVLRIEMNKLYEDYINLPHFQVLLMTDVVMLSLDRAIDDPEKLAFLQNDELSEGSWSKYLKTMYMSIFSTGEIGIKQKWHENQSEIRARVQNLMTKNLELQ